MKQRVYPIRGAIQNYAWGGKEFIPKLFNIKNIENQPFAEIWLGAHQRGPAKILDNGNSIPLDEWLYHHPEALGERVTRKFGNRLPYLFKVLDVNAMLSIQTHPTKKAAEIGFAKENEEGIELTARNRNYKDDNHKPEVMVALTDFWLLHGFKSKEAIKEILNEVPEFASLAGSFKSISTKEVDNEIFHLYKSLMEMSQSQVDDILRPLGKRLSKAFAKNKIEKSNPDYWAALAFRDNMLEGGHFDRGIFSIYIFNLVQLQKGEAIFQDAGIPHAYLEGVNMELMANSDNVFRGGLTVKHVDVNELLQHMVFEPVVPNVLQGEEKKPNVKVYKTPAPDFELSQITLKDFEAYYCTEALTPETLIVMEGEVLVESGGKEFRMERGEAFFAPAESAYSMMSDGTAVIFMAAVPV